MAASHDYRGYLRNSVDLEAGQHHRFHPAQSSETTYRPLLFGTLAIMGLLQVASSVAILLHLTGYLQEVDLSAAPHRPIEEVQREPVMNALKDTRKNRRCKTQKDSLPSAHLPIKVQLDYYKSVETTVPIIWDEKQGHLHNMEYRKEKLLVRESGFYYVYATTCFRHYGMVKDSAPTGTPNVDLSNTQLIQYICHESVKQNTKVKLIKTGSTMNWNGTSYHMYCAQQGRGLRLEEGDALFVNVSNAWLLDQESIGTYFGVIMLGK